MWRCSETGGLRSSKLLKGDLSAGVFPTWSCSPQHNGGEGAWACGDQYCRLTGRSAILTALSKGQLLQVCCLQS